MKYVTIRDFRTNSGKVQKVLKKEGEVVLTSNGKPIGLVTAVNEDTFLPTVSLMRQARAIRALGEIQKASKKSGLHTMSLAEINAEINAARKEITNK